MRRHRLLIATRNVDKVRELSELFQSVPLHLHTINDFDLPPVVEDQDTLQGNAVKKAVSCFEASGIPSLADDTGLEVDALNGAPGVYSSRFAGEHASYDENVDKLLRMLEGLPLEKRTARFRTVMALAYDGGLRITEGVCEGLILEQRRGTNGFGYDPVFYFPPLQKTFAELTLSEKNRVSHRAVALQKMRQILQEVFGA